MSETNRAIARFLDGKVLKGTTEDFFPNRPVFHLREVGSSTPQEVRCKELKAVFFVKDFAGNPQRRDRSGFLDAPRETSLGKKIAVRFKDGEVVCGYTLTYLPDRSGYFITPADPETNNLRIYVLAHATREVGLGAMADAIVRQVQSSQAA